jgi:CheY-like chemotaxis protein
VLLNLLSNAVKFTAAGEIAVTISTAPANKPDEPGKPGRPVSLPTGAGGYCELIDVLFAVRDTGIGIPADRMDRLFQSFSQVDASATRQYGGTGLGLAISRRLVELMGGRMWLESEVGKGSTFFFTIATAGVPDAVDQIELARLTKPKSQSIDTGMAARVPLRLLLAEDNAVNQKVATRILHKMGYRIDVVANGFEAIEALRRVAYDAILMDVHMPEMDGLDATRRIRREWPADEQPHIIALTANAMQGDREEYVAAGMDDYVSKPIRIDELEGALERCAERLSRQPRPPRLTEATAAAYEPEPDADTPLRNNAI